MESSVKHSCSRLAEEYATHVDLHDLPCHTILLNAVAHVVELRERRAQLIEVVTQRVWEEIVHDSNDDLGKSDDTLCQLQFLLMGDVDLRVLRSSCDLVLCDIGQTGN